MTVFPVKLNLVCDSDGEFLFIEPFLPAIGSSGCRRSSGKLDSIGFCHDLTLVSFVSFAHSFIE